MYISSPVNIVGRRVLIVEDTQQLAADMAAYVVANGGVALGPIATPSAALSALDSWPNLDAIMVDVETANGLARELLQKVEHRGVSVLWIIGDDSWFFDTNEEASVYHLDSDPENVVRVEWPRR